MLLFAQEVNPKLSLPVVNSLGEIVLLSSAVSSPEVVAVDALPVNAPTKVVEVTLDNPAMVVADDPSDIAVDPTVTLLLARFALVIPAVPDKLEFVNPDMEPPKVIVPAPVIVPPVNVIPDTVPAVATEVTVPVLAVYPEGFVLAYAPISANVQDTLPEPSTVFPVEPIVIVLPVVHAPAVVAVEALPVRAPTNVVEVTEVNPVKVVVAAAPNVNVCEPNDTEELARLAFEIPAVPDKFEFVIPDKVPPRVKFPVEVTVPDKLMPETVPVPETEVTPLLTTFVAHEAVAA